MGLISESVCLATKLNLGLEKTPLTETRSRENTSSGHSSTKRQNEMPDTRRLIRELCSQQCRPPDKEAEAQRGQEGYRRPLSEAWRGRSVWPWMLLSCLLSPPELRSHRNLRPWSGIPALISKYRAARPHTVSSPHLQDSSPARFSAFISEARTEVKCCERSYSPTLPGVPMPSLQTPCGGPSRYCETEESEHVSH